MVTTVRGTMRAAVRAVVRVRADPAPMDHLITTSTCIAPESSTDASPTTSRSRIAASRRPLGGSVLRRLFDDWETIAHRPAVVRRARAWGLGVDFDDLDGLVRAVGYRPRPSEAGPASSPAPAGAPAVNSPAAAAPWADPADELLGRLLIVARDDELAARVVLHRLLPGLCAAARRWSVRRVGGSDDAFDDIIAAAWVVIRNFPVERRPGQFAPKLLRDAEHQAFVKATRRCWTSEAAEPASFDRRPAAVEAEWSDPAEELTDVVALARPHLSDYDLRLLELLRSGRTIPEVAAELGVSVRTVGYHREALVRRMRSALVA